MKTSHRHIKILTAHTHISVTKIKKDLIHKAKVKKQYAKVKAREQEQQQQQDEGDEKDQEEHDDQDHDGAEEQALHPTRQLMLKDEEAAQTGAAKDEEDGHDGEDHGHGPTSDGQRRRTRRPGYYDKQLKKAEQKRAEAEARAQEVQRRREERERKIAQREKYRRAMAKTRGPDGKKKLGRESTILLDKVKRMMEQQ